MTKQQTNIIANIELIQRYVDNTLASTRNEELASVYAATMRIGQALSKAKIAVWDNQIKGRKAFDAYLLNHTGMSMDNMLRDLPYWADKDYPYRSGFFSDISRLSTI